MKLGSIQFLRAIAVILIVYANAIIMTYEFGKPKQAEFYHLGSFGLIGFDLLFVVSGFVTCYAAGKYRGTADGFRFLQRRFFRVNIIFYIASLLFCGALMLKSWVANGFVLFEPAAELQKAIDTVLIVPATDAQFLYNPYYPLTWALAFIWLAYLLFFITILARVKQKIWIMAGLIATLSILWYVVKPVDLRLTFLLNPILLEFLLGMVIYQLYQRPTKVPVFLAYALLSAGLAWYLILVFINKNTLSFSGNILAGILSLERVLYWGAPSGLLLAGCVLLEKSGQFNKTWNNRLFRLIGDASFSIFLTHLIVFILLGALYKQVGFFLSTDINVILALPIALAIGIAFYRWIEKPLINWINRPTERQLSRGAISQPAS